LAEEIEVSNVGGNGVASEATLAKLVVTIEAWAKKNGVDPKAEAAKLQKLHNEAIKSGITTYDNSDAAQKKNVKSVGKASKAADAFASRLGGAMMGALGAAAGAIKGLGNELLQGGDNFSDFTKHIPIVGSLLGPLAGLIDNSIESFRQLSTVGGAIGNDITKVRRAAADMELNMDEYTQLIINNSDAFRVLGGNVQNGQMRFAEMNKNLKASGSFAELKNLGFTIMDVNEGMAEYITLQRNSGRLEGKSTETLAKGSANYLKQIDLLARATGKSRKEVEASLQAQATDAGIRGLLDAFRDASGNLSEEGLNLQASLALIDQYAGSSGTAFKELLMGLPQSDVTAEFLAGLGEAGPAIQAALVKVGEGADPQVLIDAMANAGGALEKFAAINTGKGAVADAKARAIFITGLRKTNPSLADFLDMSTKLTAVKNVNIKDLKAQQKITNDGTKNMLTFDDTIKSIRSVIQTALIDSGLFETLGDAFGGLNDTVGDPKFKQAIQDLADAFTSKTKEFIALFKEGGFKAVFDNAISGLGSILGDAFISVVTNPKVILGIAGAFAALFALKAVSGAFTSGIGKLFGGGGGGGGSSKGGGGKGGGAGGKIGKNVGGFVGGLAEGVMKGAAAGIRAFAHPMVPVGALAIGAAIAAIGAGIAGAAWILGKSLPTFVEGLSSFESIDGAKLGAAAVGMVKLSGAMAAFGTGTAVAGLGSMVGGITGAIGKLFGADDPLAQLEKFSAAKIDGAQVKTNADAMMAFQTAMTAAAGGTAAKGLGDMVGGIAGGIGKLFGADDPLKNLEKFSAAKIDGTQVKTNAEALIAFSTAMAASGGAKAVTGLGDMVGGIAGGIGKLFGADDTLTNLKTFGDTKVDSVQVKANAEAMANYADAMKSVAPGAVAGLGELVGNIAGGIGKLFGVGDPTKDLEKFSKLSIDGAKVTANAGAMVAFGDAMTALPTTMPGDGVFTSFGKAIAGFFGADTPFDQLSEFGNLTVNAAGVKTNSEAMMNFAAALTAMPTSEMGTLNLPSKFVSRLQKMSEIDGAALKTVVAELSTLSAIPNLKVNLDALKDVGKSKSDIEELAEALETLVDQMKEVNKNSISASTSAAGGVGSGGGNGGNQLNTTMQGILTKLDKLGILEDIEKNTKYTGTNVFNLAERL